MGVTRDSFLAIAGSVLRDVLGEKRAERFWVEVNRPFFPDWYENAIAVTLGEIGGAGYTWNFTPAGWRHGEDSAVEESIAIVEALAYRFYRPRFRIGRDRQRLIR